MAIDFLEGLASTVNDVLNPLFDLASKLSHLFSFPKESPTSSIDTVEPFR